MNLFFEEIIEFITCPNLIVDKYIKMEDYINILNLIDNDMEKRNDLCDDCIIKDLSSILKHMNFLIIIHYFSICNFLFFNKYVLIIDKCIRTYNNIYLVEEYIMKNKNLIIYNYEEISILDFLLKYGKIENKDLYNIYKKTLKKINNISILNNFKICLVILKSKNNSNKYSYNVYGTNNMVTRKRYKVLLKEIIKRISYMYDRLKNFKIKEKSILEYILSI